MIDIEKAKISQNPYIFTDTVRNISKRWTNRYDSKLETNIACMMHLLGTKYARYNKYYYGMN